MRFEREVFMNSPEELSWIIETHLMGLATPAFGSFVLAGNEDSPVRLDLYKAHQPAYNEQPIETFHRNADGALVQGRAETATPE